MKPGKILIINPFGIGDVLFATPLVRRLRRQFPGSFIGFICNKKTAPLLYANKNIDEVYIFEKGDYRDLWKKNKIKCVRQFFNFLKKIKSEKFDIAIDLSLGRQYVFFLKLISVPVRIGYDFKSRGRLLTHKIDINGYHDKHVVEYYVDLCRFLAFDSEDNKSPDLFIPEEDLAWADNFLKDNGVSANEKIFAVIPGGGASWGKTSIYKHWPAENFAKVADLLIDKYAVKVVILGGPDDIDVCSGVIKAMRNRAVFACGKATLLQFAALLKRCALVICNDGGSLHIAVAAGVKTISIFGPVDENVYGPYPPSDRHIVIKEDINCRPCYKHFKFNQCQERLCLMNIRPQDVVKAAEKLLS